MRTLLLVLASLWGTSHAFAPVQPYRSTSSLGRPLQQPPHYPNTAAIGSSSTSPRPSTALAGLFGLGAPELAVIAIAAAFLLGPDKLADLGKDAGKVAGQLKEVPKEFQQGMAEGEAEARAMKAVDNVKAVDVEKEE